MEFVQSSDQAAGNLEYAAYYSGSIRSCDRLGETDQRGTHGGVHQRHIEMIRENQRENFPKKSQKTLEPLRFQGFSWRGRRDLNPRCVF